MTGSRNRTHVDEWADLVGDEVPEYALRERTLGRDRPERDPEKWSDGLS